MEKERQEYRGFRGRELDSEWSEQKLYTWSYPRSPKGSIMILDSEYGAPMDDYATLYPEGSAIAKTVPTMIWLGVLIGAVVVVSAILLGKLKKKHL